MTTLTVFTPTYNRAHLLPRLYDSLCRQTVRDFCWLVVDDGSVDDTRALVQKWVGEGVIPIEYIYKSNGGMHTAHNAAYARIETPLNVCIDSDDAMPPRAVESIVRHWRAVEGDPNLAGMLGLDVDMRGEVIGGRFPRDGLRATLGEVYGKYRVKGDKKIVLQTRVVRSFPPYPEYAGERLVPLGSLYTLIDRDYGLVCFNEAWAVVDYQLDGSSANVAREYFRSPMGFRYDALVNIASRKKLVTKLKNFVKLGVVDFIRGRAMRFQDSPAPLLSLFLFPVSFLAYLWIKYRAQQS